MRSSSGGSGRQVVFTPVRGCNVVGKACLKFGLLRQKVVHRSIVEFQRVREEGGDVVFEGID